ncbi:MAG: DNA-directed RNA polymerases I II and III subunit RPABC2 [Watsoniomyces obsoletus]|nr:MAG: DNA-directed RNA polymerases I II and III subunit RPABC2 [Watsoniomyces obsoletus]
MSTYNRLPRLAEVFRCKNCCSRSINRPSLVFSTDISAIAQSGLHRPSQRKYATAASAQDTLPRIARPSLWKSLIPRSLRRSSSPKSTPKRPKQEWNPATFYIFMFMLIGSQAIQTIALRTEYATFSRRADARIKLLREVIKRVNKGEEVDVEGLLGTEDELKEKEWEEVLREIEEEDRLWQDTAKQRQQSPNSVEENDERDSASEASKAALATEGPSQNDTSSELAGNELKEDGKRAPTWFR